MKIMVGYDGSNVAKEALLLAKKHAKAFDANVYLITTLTRGPDLLLEDIQKAEHELERIKNSFKKDQIPCETHAIVSSLTAGEDLVHLKLDRNAVESLPAVPVRQWHDRKAG